MITEIEAVNCRCLRNVPQTLGNFYVLPGEGVTDERVAFRDIECFVPGVGGDSQRMVRNLMTSTVAYESVLWAAKSGLATNLVKTGRKLVKNAGDRRQDRSDDWIYLHRKNLKC